VPANTLHHDGFRIAGRVILLFAFGLSWDYKPRRFFQGYN
jgi:hypothetical protein